MTPNQPLLYIFLVILPINSFAQSKNHFPARDSIQIANIYNDWLNAYRNKDIDKVMAIFDSRVVGAAYASGDLNYTELRNGYQREFSHVDERNIWSLQSVNEIRGSETLAVVRTTWILHPKQDRQKVLATNKSIDVFEKIHGSWKVIRWFTHVARK